MAEQRISPQMVVGEPSSFQLIVLVAGIATTAAALTAVYFLNTSADVNVMGWYLDYVLPAGAFLVGIGAGSGYGAASWITGLKIQHRLLWIIVALQILAYAGAQYVAFRSLGPLQLPGDDHLLTFPEYFDFEARNFAWKQENGKTGEPLGEWGYLFRALELAGFAAGGLIVPAALFKKPYCESCRIYMRTQQLALVAASVPKRKIKASNPAGKAEYDREQEQAFQSAADALKSVCICGTGNDIEGYRAALAAAGAMKKGVTKLPKRMAIKRTRCKRCGSGYLTTHLLTGQGKQLVTTQLEKVELPAGFPV